MPPLAGLGRDVRHALRAFGREPALVAGILLTFALAIGTTAAMLGLVNRLMFAPPAGVHDAGRVARVSLGFLTDDGDVFTTGTLSYPAFRSIAALDAAFDGVAAVRPETLTVGRGADLAEVAVVQASGDWFALLGVRPVLGRAFGPADDAPPMGNPVAVLAHAYWERRFGGDRDVVGRELVVDDRAFTIVGVAPEGFTGTEPAGADLFIPLSAGLGHRESGWWSDAGRRMVTVVARLRDGMTPAAAADVVAAALGAETASSFMPVADAAVESVVPGAAARRSPQARIALLLAAVAVVVLLIATANVGTLLLLRAARRRQEVAVRIALGAGHAHLVRQWVVESVVLAAGGGLAGLLLARWLADAIRVTLLPAVSASAPVLDGRVLLLSLLLVCGAGVAAGLAPVAQLSGRSLAADLRGGAGASRRTGAQGLLVGVQVALCMLLLVGAGLFVRSLQRVRAQDLGFSTSRLLHVTLDVRGPVPALERDRLHEEAARRLALLPGVTGATVVQGMPFSSHHIPPIHVPGAVLPPPSEAQLPIMYGATAAYLDMMGVTLREGRLLTDADGRDAPLVVLVNETMARTLWPDGGALGRCVQAGVGPGALDGDPMAAAASLPCRTVVGVVRDSRARSLRLEGGEDRLMQYYVPFAQLPGAPMPDVPVVHALLVRTAGDPARHAAAVQRAIQGGSARPVYARVRPYQELLDPQLRSWRLGATLFTAFGLLALGIAAVGLFGVVSYLVTQRTREIGVRLALGGTRPMVARRVVADAARLAGIGVAAGALLALAGAPLVESLLFQTPAREPMSLIGAALVLVGVTVCAAAVPAWRASRVSPMIALREDG